MMLIVKEELLTELDKYCGNQQYLISENIRDIIKNFPAVEIESLNFGGWMPRGEQLKYIYEFICSNCGHKLYTENIYNYKFCPNCGAKMCGDKK
jgi:rubrerythrin